MTSPLMETPPRWHGVLAWIVACLLASVGVISIIVMKDVLAGRSTIIRPDDIAQFLMAIGIATASAMVVVAAPSFLIVWGLRALRWRRGIADVLAGAALGFVFPLLTLLVPKSQPGEIMLAALLFALLGAMTGFVYWAVARWLAGRWWKKQLQLEADVF